MGLTLLNTALIKCKIIKTQTNKPGETQKEQTERQINRPRVTIQRAWQVGIDQGGRRRRETHTAAQRREKEEPTRSGLAIREQTVQVGLYLFYDNQKFTQSV